MTREEAIKHIKDIICENNTVKHSDIVVFEEEKEALRMAIQALSQEPCDKCAMKNSNSDYCENCTVIEYHGEKVSVPTKFVEKEPCTDAQERYEDLCEYFGDAKDILKNRKDFKAWLGRIKWHIRKAEELYEKYEYKKEPCDDVISRDAVIDVIYDSKSSFTNDFAQGFFADKIRDLPSVNLQEPCDDAISRNDMLDAVGHGTTYTSLEVQKIIKGLPSVNTVPCTDAVSREDVIKLVECSGYDLQFRTDNADMCDDVRKLPSVNPQPICEEREKGECPYYAG